MSRQLASIRKIFNIRPIEGADKLEMCNVLGWQCVIEKGKFKEGDLVVYFEVDSWLPERPEYEFLRKNCWKENENGKGFRIKTIKLKKQISQGLIMSINDCGLVSNASFSENIDVTEILNVKLYNPPIPACLKGSIKGTIPNFLPKTDETRVQLLQSVLDRYKGKQCYITEKVDGASITCYIKDGVFGVCSRNIELLEGTDAYWETVRKLKIEEKMRQLIYNNHDVALQGELIGPGIQGNPLQLDEKTILWFNIFDIVEYKYYDYDVFIRELKHIDLLSVPILNEQYELENDINKLVEMSIAKSILNPKILREGVVIRPIHEKLDMQMAQGFGNGRLSFKVLNPEYFLENERE